MSLEAISRTGPIVPTVVVRANLQGKADLQQALEGSGALSSQRTAQAYTYRSVESVHGSVAQVMDYTKGIPGQKLDIIA